MTDEELLQAVGDTPVERLEAQLSAYDDVLREEGKRLPMPLDYEAVRDMTDRARNDIAAPEDDILGPEAIGSLVGGVLGGGVYPQNPLGALGMQSLLSGVGATAGRAYRRLVQGERMPDYQIDERGNLIKDTRSVLDKVSDPPETDAELLYKTIGDLLGPGTLAAEGTALVGAVLPTAGAVLSAPRTQTIAQKLIPRFGRARAAAANEVAKDIFTSDRLAQQAAIAQEQIDAKEAMQNIFGRKGAVETGLALGAAHQAAKAAAKSGIDSAERAVLNRAGGEVTFLTKAGERAKQYLQGIGRMDAKGNLVGDAPLTDSGASLVLYDAGGGKIPLGSGLPEDIASNINRAAGLKNPVDDLAVEIWKASQKPIPLRAAFDLGKRLRQAYNQVAGDKAMKFSAAETYGLGREITEDVKDVLAASHGDLKKTYETASTAFHDMMEGQEALRPVLGAIKSAKRVGAKTPENVFSGTQKGSGIAVAAKNVPSLTSPLKDVVVGRLQRASSPQVARVLLDDALERSLPLFDEVMGSTSREALEGAVSRWEQAENASVPAASFLPRAAKMFPGVIARGVSEIGRRPVLNAPIVSALLGDEPDAQQMLERAAMGALLPAGMLWGALQQMPSVVKNTGTRMFTP